jgi:transcription antitermination factor NusG
VGWGGARANSGPKRTRFKTLAPIGPRWFVLITAPQQEVNVSDRLMSMGYKTHVEIENELVVFRSVVFVHFDRDRDNWGELIRTPLVRKLLRGVGQSTPAPLPPEFMLSLTLQGHPDIVDLTPFPVGSTVTLNDGPLAGQPGVVIKCDGKTTTAQFSLLSSPVLVTRPRTSYGLKIHDR